LFLQISKKGLLGWIRRLEHLLTMTGFVDRYITFILNPFDLKIKVY